MSNLQDQILAAINFQTALGIVITAGLALIGLAFVSFVLRQGSNAASGRIGDADQKEEEDD